MRRSVQQNRYYFGVVVKYQLKHYQHNIGDLIRDILEAVKWKLTPEFIHQLNKMLHNKALTTKNKETDQFEEYILAVRGHMAATHGLDVPPPNEEDYNEV